MNWSMITCAPLAKSPNCASQSTGGPQAPLGVAELEAQAGRLRQRAVVDSIGACAREMLDGEKVWPVFASCSTMWRWLNVPRSTSWPVMRIGTPSTSSEANASALALRPVDAALAPTASRFFSSCLTSLGWTVKPSGAVRSSSLSAMSSSAGTAVSTGAGRAVELVLAGRLLDGARLLRLLDLDLEALGCRRVSSSQMSCCQPSTSSAATPSPMSFAA